MNRMLIVGTVNTSQLKSSSAKYLRVYRLDNKVIKDITFENLAPVAEKLNVGNIYDFQSAAVKALYPEYYCGSGTSKLLSGVNSCYVIGTHGSGGYVCIRPHIEHDYIRVIPRSRLVQDVKKRRIYLINAIIEQIDGHDTVSPINGVWEDASFLTGRVLSEGADADNAAEDVYTGKLDKSDKIAAGESITSHDELGILNSEQKNFLKDYYINYSVEAFNRIAGATSWKLKAGKTERLVELRKLSNGEDWRFAGLWDCGSFGAQKCEMGHKLRYVYMACPVNRDFNTAVNDGTLLKFGIVCHADFLEIPREDVARLGKLQDTMCDEIAFISTVVANNRVDQHCKLMSSMLELLLRLKENGTLAVVIGERLLNAYEGFIANNIPLVESFVLDIQKKLENYGALKVLSAAGIDTSDFDASPSPLYAIPELSADASAFEKKQYPSRCRAAHQDGIYKIYRSHESFFTALTRYAEMLIGNDICGEYMYIPTHEITEFRKRGAEKYKRYDRNDVALKYNETTRELRFNWMVYFANHTYEKEYLPTTSGLKAQYLSLSGIERFAVLARRLRTAGKKIAAAVGEKIIKEIDLKLTDAYRLNLESYEPIKPTLLMAALPYESDVSRPGLLRRRCVQNAASSKILLDLLDETQNGTSNDYIAKIKNYFTPQELKQQEEQIVESKQQAPPVQQSSTSIHTVEPKSVFVPRSEPSPGLQSAQQQQSKQASEQQYKRRGDPKEAKTLVEKFNSLYLKLPKEYTNESSIKIAVDIIDRFNGKLKQQEGFSSREKWRVENEIERLVLIEKQLKRDGKI